MIKNDWKVFVLVVILSVPGLSGLYRFYREDAVTTVCGWSGDTRSFAKVGDSITYSISNLNVLDTENVVLDKQDVKLWDAVGYFRHSSFGRSSIAGVPGITSEGLLDGRCNGQSVVQCEYDRMNARTALIMIGTNDPAGWVDSGFSKANINTLLKYTLDRGMVPVLYTIPFDVNKDVVPLNKQIRELAYTYNVYLVDYYTQMEKLPNHGLGDDGIHPSKPPVGLEANLTYPLLVYGYSLRNELTLKALEDIRQYCGWY